MRPPALADAVLGPSEPVRWLRGLGLGYPYLYISIYVYICIYINLGGSMRPPALADVVLGPSEPASGTCSTLERGPSSIYVYLYVYTYIHRSIYIYIDLGGGSMRPPARADAVWAPRSLRDVE